MKAKMQKAAVDAALWKVASGFEAAQRIEMAVVYSRWVRVIRKAVKSPAAAAATTAGIVEPVVIQPKKDGVVPWVVPWATIDALVLKQIADMDAARRLRLAAVYARWARALRQSIKTAAVLASNHPGRDAVRSEAAAEPESKAGRSYPALCEPELQEVCAEWSPKKRRYLADKFERWLGQLRFSADFIEKFDGQDDDDDVELAIPSYELAEELRNLKRSECLAKAAKFEEWSATIRRMLGLSGKPKPQAGRAADFMAAN